MKSRKEIVETLIRVRDFIAAGGQEWSRSMKRQLMKDIKTAATTLTKVPNWPIRKTRRGISSVSGTDHLFDPVIMDASREREEIEKVKNPSSKKPEKKQSKTKVLPIVDTLSMSQEEIVEIIDDINSTFGEAEAEPAEGEMEGEASFIGSDSLEEVEDTSERREDLAEMAREQIQNTRRRQSLHSRCRRTIVRARLRRRGRRR